MTKQKVIIRVDGNSNIGLGHIYRGIALAEMLKDEFSIVFITKKDTVISPITDAAFDYILLPEKIGLLQEPLWFKNNFALDSIIILDGYAFTEDYQQQIKEISFKLVYIDDFALGTQKADLVINHSPGIKKTDYKSENYTNLALGLGYAILRPAFIEAAKIKRVITKIDTAFVCFGGSDIYDLTLKSTLALLEIKQFKKINIVIGDAYKHLEIDKLQKRNLKINIYRNLSEKEILSIMHDSNFAIAPASTIAYEICAVKMPLLCGYYVENQENIYKGLLQKNIIYPLGYIENLLAKDIVKAVNEMLKSLNIAAITDNQQQQFDGKAKNRIINKINELNVSLRNVNNEDLLLLYNWINEKSVRHNALNTKKIKFEDHNVWFNKVMHSNKTYIYILENKEKTPIGQVRFDLIDNEYVIDYSIDKSFRGKGYGKLVLEKGIEKVAFETKGVTRLKAFVKKDNIVSSQIFIKLGFKSSSNTDVIQYKKQI